MKKLKSYFKQLIGSCCLLAIVVLTANAQHDAMKPVVRHYAITGATVVVSPTSTLENATVLLKDGVITSVGNNVDIPPTAKTIDGKEMFIYAGFINGMTHVGIEKKDKPRKPSDVTPGNPGNELAGIQPHHKAIDKVDPQHKSIVEMQKAGFTTAHIVPRGQMLPGKGALMHLNGKTADQMVISPETAMFFQLETANRMYPSTVIGVMAKFRELYKNAEISSDNQQAYEDSPSGQSPPTFSQEMMAMKAVVKGEQPVFCKASSLKDFYRMQELQSELGFKMVVADFKQGWDAVEIVKNQQLPLFVSLDLPEGPKEKEEKDDKEENDKKKKKGKKEAEKKEVVVGDKEKLAELEKRKAEALKQHYAMAAKLQEAGITFGFSGSDLKAKDIRKNIGLMIENGLTKEQALAALTTQAAELLGVSNQMGTVEVGKIANLAISKGDYFEKDSKISYLLVNGDLIDFTSDKKEEAK